MTLDQIEELIRKYLAMGMTVVIILSGAGTGGTSGSASPTIITISPTSSPTRTTGTPSTGTPSTDIPSTDAPSTGTPYTGTPGTTTPRTGTPRTTAPRTTTPYGGYGDGTGVGSDGGGTGATDAGSAAAKFGWGAPTRGDDFTSGTGQWTFYDGAGHDGKGRRSPSAASVGNGVLTITGSPGGTTAGMAWNPGQKYGRWEARVKSPMGDPTYHAVLLLWPDAENWPAGGEVDFMEISDAQRRNVDFFLHHGASNAQEHGSVAIDATQWHDWAVEWTPKGITAYVDGTEWYRITDTTTLPPGPMHMTIQLDWFPKGGTSKQTQMMVDWVRQYPPA